MNNNLIVDDDPNGTSIATVKKHLNKIGYIPNNNNIVENRSVDIRPVYNPEIALEPLPQFQLPENSIDTQIEKPSPQLQKEHRPDPFELAKDINQSLDGFAPSNKPDKTNEEEDLEEKEYEMPDYIKEALLIFILYFFISQPIVYKVVQTKVKTQSNIIKIIILGFILAILFVIFKNLTF